MRLITSSAIAATILALSPPAPAQQVYSVATNPQGSIYYAAGAAISKLAGDKLNLQFRVQPMAGSSTYLPLLNRGEVDFSFNNVDDLDVGFRGLDIFEGKPNPNIRLVAVIFSLPFSIMVPADSPVKSLRELKGLRMPSEFNAQITGRKLHEAVLATVGLSLADMRQVPAINLFVATEMVATGRVDAAGTAPGTAQVQKAHVDLASRGGVRFLPLETAADAVARMRTVMNSRPILIQPARHLPGINEPTWVMGYSAFLTTNDKASDELVYNLVKMLHASRDALVAAVPSLASFDPGVMTERHVAPYHSGAVKFYGETKQWPPKT